MLSPVFIVRFYTDSWKRYLEAKKHEVGKENTHKIDQQMDNNSRVQIHNLTSETDTRSTLPLDRIQSRETNTRKLRQSHVIALAESIALLGLLEPIVVDRGGKLLAGGHRLAAIRWLKDSNPTAYTEHFPGDGCL